MLMPRYSEQDCHKDNNFIGKHGHASTTVAAHTKMRLLNKVEHNMRQNQQNLIQNQHQSPNQNQNLNQNLNHNRTPNAAGHNQSINKLIITAAAGNGLVGDVDELLTPMRIKGQPHIPPHPTAVGEGASPADGGVSFNGSSASVDSKEFHSHSRPERNLWSRAEMLEMLNIMQQMNALEQLSDRNVKSEHVFRQIEEIMRSKGYVKKSSIQIWTKWKFLKSTYNTTTRHGHGIPKVVPEEVYRVLCRMLRDCGNCTGIGSEYGNSMDSSNAELAKPVVESEDCKDELGVEHPIFGFRLGLVKPEPLDTGYETSAKQENSREPEIDTVDFVQSGDMSNRIHDQTPAMDHTPFMAAVKNEPEMDLGMDGTNTPPPTAPTSPSPPPTSMDANLYSSTPYSRTMPPLRVAAFANNNAPRRTTPTHGVLQIERPAAAPANKSTPNPGKVNRTMPLHSTSSINFVHPTTKLMLPRKQLPLRIPREISVQPANMRPLKAVPIRETGYSLRPDRMIPDLEQSISPPQSPSPPMHVKPAVPKYPAMPYASTSRQAQMLNEQQQRKRRLNYPPPSPVPVKLQRNTTLFDNNNRNNISFRNDEATPPAEVDRIKLRAERMQRRKQQQDELFKTEMTQLTTAMRKAQKEMLENFFQRQKQLARREHEFQLRQDNLIMSALRKQTDVLLRAAKSLEKSEGNEEEEGEAILPTNEELQQQDHNEATNVLMVEPDITLQESSFQPEDDDLGLDHDDDEDDDEEGMDHYEEDDIMYSDDGNQSEAAMETSISVVSEDASSRHSGNPSEAQLSII